MNQPLMGQTIYVHRYFPFKGDKPNLTPFTVTDIGEDYFSAVEQSAGLKQASRFELDTWTYETNSYQFTAYPTEEAYWEKQTAEDSENLRKQMISEIEERELPELMSLKNCMEN